MRLFTWPYNLNKLKNRLLKCLFGSQIKK